MNVHTHSTTFAAPADRVFAFVSNIENLPEWAPGFCQELRKDGDDYFVTTPGGEIFFRIDHQASTGVVDMVAGPQKNQTMTWPARVAGLPNGECLFTFTVIQTPDMSDDAYAEQNAAIKGEFENIRNSVE